MGERKVLNFYIAPDFDHSIIPKSKKDWDKLHEIRMMLPFSLRCNTCGEYMYMGKKFNSKKELIKGEDYLGIRKFRFYIKCSVCSAEIAFKTDPKNSDYELESGATRNFELWKETKAEIDAEKTEREEESKQDAMKSLEHRTIDSKMEMDVLDALDEIKSINQRHERVNTTAVLAALQRKTENSAAGEEKKVQELREEEAAVRAFLKRRDLQATASSASESLEDEFSSAGKTASKELNSEGVLDNDGSTGGETSTDKSLNLGQTVWNQLKEKQTQAQHQSTTSAKVTVVRKRKQSQEESREISDSNSSALRAKIESEAVNDQPVAVSSGSTGKGAAAPVNNSLFGAYGSDDSD